MASLPVPDPLPVPNFNYGQQYGQYLHAAITLATDPEQRAQVARLVLDLYLSAFRESRPLRDALAHQEAMTPWPGGAYYIKNAPDERTPRKVKKPKVKRAKSSRGRKSGTESTPKAKQEQEGAILPHSASIYDPTVDPVDIADIEGQNKLAGIKKQETEKRLRKAIAELKTKVPRAGTHHEFYTAATKFVLGRVRNRMWDVDGECATTEHDVTNEIMLQLSQTDLDEIDDICPYLAKMAWNAGSRAFTDNNADRATHLPLLVEKEGEDGEIYTEQNPLIELQEFPEHRRELPKFIQGTDLLICNLIREDYTYAQIAESTGLTVAAVKMRIKRMREQNQNMNKEKEETK